LLNHHNPKAKAKMFSSGEKEVALPAPIRTYTIHGDSDADSRELSIVPEGFRSALYTTSIAAHIDMHHPNSITLKAHSAARPVVGAVRMYTGCETINIALGDPEDFTQREHCVWEDMHVTHPAQTGPQTGPQHAFGLGLGDDLRRDFHWVLEKVYLTAGGPAAAPAHPARTHSWNISDHVPTLARAHTFSFGNKSSGKKDAAMTAVHEVLEEDLLHRRFRLVDDNDGETVAILLRHGDVRNGALVEGDDRDASARGKVFIFRDFWQSGRYQEEWDRMVLLTGLAALERGDRE
jgi:hypothetical protein